MNYLLVVQSAVGNLPDVHFGANFDHLRFDLRRASMQLEASASNCIAV